MSNLAGIQLQGETNRGLVRSRNEDSFCLAAYDGENSALAVVADGIGGQRDGDIASFFCCHKLLIAWQNRPVRAAMTAAQATAFFEREIQEINRQLYSYNRRERQTQAMGSTVAAAIFLPGKTVIAHAGDSRIYRLKREEIDQLTTDHTLLNKLHANGKMPMQFTVHELSHIISRAVGPRPQLELELKTVDRQPDDRYLLCTDGLSRHIPLEQISGILRQAEDPRTAINRLMRLALIAGGSDNIALICGFSAEEPHDQAGSEKAL